MKYRPRWSVLSIGAIVVILLFTYPSWRRLFLGRASQGRYPAASDAQREALERFGRANRDSAATAYVAMLTVVPAPTNEQPTPVLRDAQVILSGSFVDMDGWRQGKGSVKMYRSADGALLLRFDDFTATNGPDLEVLLCANPEPKLPTELDIEGASRFPVGPLKGTQGNQQFPIPRQLDLLKYKSVVLYSEQLKSIYSYATLVGP